MRQALITTCCPDRDTWSEFYAGKAAPEVLPALAAHLDQCPACQAVLHTLSAATADEADALLAGLRSASSHPDAYEGEPECRLAVERAWALVPEAAGKPAPVPERLGEYRVVRLIGRGGMGAVYRAVHVRLGREVALKVVPPERARAAAAARFQREVSAHGKLDHPNVVRATDAGEADGVAFLVMDLVDGIDLDRLVRACGPLPVADACELARQAAVGLHHLTGHGLVHRDVKPSNLMLDRRGEVKVLDLGLAAATDRLPDAALTGDGQVVGTFDYLAPEQADPGGPVDARTDVYGLGCSLYFLLTGKPPYTGPDYTTPRSKILAHTAGPVPQVRAARPSVPPGLSAVLVRMLAKNPAERFLTPAAVATALAPFCAGADLARLLTSAGLDPLPQSPHASPVAPGSPPRPGRRRARTLALAAVGLLLVGVGVSAAVKFWPPAPTPVAQGGADAPLEGPAQSEPPRPEPKEPLPPAPKEDAKPVHPVALLGFEERGAEVKGFGAKVGDLLFAKLAAKPEFYLVDRTDLKKVLDEQQLSLSGVVKADEAVKVGQLTGARIIVTGSVVQVEKRVYLVAKIIGTETGRVFGASVDGASSDDLGELVGRLADAVDAAVAKNADKLVPKPVPVVDRVAELNKKLGNGVRPTVMVRMSGPAAQTEFTRFARECGFEVIDPDEGGASKADVLITGEGFSEAVGRVGGLVSARVRVDLKAVGRASGKVLVADRQTAVVVDVSEQVAGKTALQYAAADLAERLLPRLVAPDKKK